MAAVNSKINEPSMEEILASIRRIIADDQDSLQETPTSDRQDESSPLKNVLDIAEMHASAILVPEQPEPEAKNVAEPQEEPLAAAASSMSPPSVYRIERAPPRPVNPAKPEPKPMPQRQAPLPKPSSDVALLSEESNAAVLEAFDRLNGTVPASSPKTLEDLAKEILRPMLKTWLDDNLPSLVERLVQAEIERVSRGRR